MWTRFWQNFLINPAIVDFIINDIKKRANLLLDTIEIWPGKCALTRELIKIKPDLKVFEKDKDLFNYLLKCLDTNQIIIWDFLQVNISQIIKNKKINVIGNLPYYITSPIFRKLSLQETPHMDYWIFMVQKEVWEKIKTNAKNKSMLWYLLNLNYNITYLKTVSSENFSPSPKVDSCLIRFEYTGANKNIDPNWLFKLLSLINPVKKKTLWKIQKILEKQWYKFSFPEQFKNKRIHELNYDDINKIIFGK